MSYQLHPADASLYSDMYKDAYGFRPRHIIFESKETFKKAIEDLGREISLQIEEEEAQEKICIEKLESKISQTMDVCKCSWKRAFEILMEAENDVYSNSDVEHFLYNWGICGKESYNMFMKFKESK